MYDSILTVITPPLDRMLVALETVKEELNITTDASDRRLTRWILEAGAAIEGYVERTLRQETVTESLRLHTGNHRTEHYYPRLNDYHDHGLNALISLHVRRYPIAAIISIVEDGNTLDPLTDFEFDPFAGLIYRLSGSARISWMGTLILVTYTGGYLNVDDVPGDLQAACIQMVKHRNAARGRDPMLRQMNVPGVVEQQFWVPSGGDMSNFPPEIEALVSRYRDAHL